MAIATPGPLVTGISGTVGAVTFRGVGGVCVVSQSPVMVNKATAAQAQARSVLALAAARWAALTDNQQLQWSAFGSRVTWRTSTGRAWQPSGRALYMRHMGRWLTADPDVAEMEPVAFPAEPPVVTLVDATVGSYTGISWSNPPGQIWGIFSVARSMSTVGWSRVCWHVVQSLLFHPPLLVGTDLRPDQLPIMGEFVVGELVRVRIQWLMVDCAITPEPVYHDTVAV